MSDRKPYIAFSIYDAKRLDIFQSEYIPAGQKAVRLIATHDVNPSMVCTRSGTTGFTFPCPSLSKVLDCISPPEG